MINTKHQQLSVRRQSELLKIKISMTGKERCSNNAYIERLWRTFKYEGSYLYQWNTVEELKLNIGKWVYWYNYERPHQSLFIQHSS